MSAPSDLWKISEGYEKKSLFSEGGKKKRGISKGGTLSLLLILSCQGSKREHTLSTDGGGGGGGYYMEWSMMLGFQASYSQTSFACVADALNLLCVGRLQRRLRLLVVFFYHPTDRPKIRKRIRR